jgi:hypothetical protein
MTIYHKSMLAGAAAIASVEDDSALRTVLIEPSGEVVAACRWAYYAASPTLPAIAKSLPISDAPLRRSACVPVAQVSALCRAVPNDRQFKGMLEHVSISQVEGNTLLAVYNDGKGNPSVTLRSARINGELLAWRRCFASLGKPVVSLSEFVFNRRRLDTVVSALGMACRYDGEFDFIAQKPFANGYVWVARNGQTGQSVTVAWTLPTAKVETNEWEKKLLI